MGLHYKIAGYDVYLGEVAVSMGAILLFGLICIRSKPLSGAIQAALGVLLLAGIVICFGFVFFKTGSREIFTPPFAWGEKPYVQILKIITLAPWAFVGFESISHSAGEFRFSPKKSFIIITLALLAAGLAYVLLAMLAAAGTPDNYGSWAAYVSELGRLKGLKALPVFFATREAMGAAGPVLLAVTLIAAVITGLVGNTIAASRLIYAMAGEEALPKELHVLGRQNTPKNVLLFIMAVSAFIPLLGRTAIGWIVDVNTVGATIAYGYTSAAAFKAARTKGCKGVQWTGALGILIAAAFLLLALAPNSWSISALATESYLILMVWGLLGLAFFRVVVGKDQERRFGKSIVVWVGMLLLLFFTSAVWMSQDMKDSVRALVRSASVYEQLSALLTRDYLIQAALIALSLVIVFSIFSLMSKRERALEIQRTQAEKANTAKSEFLANMSHEIRTPINAILGMNEMIIRSSTDKGITTYARNVESAGKNLLSIINDILDFSKIEAGKMEIANADYKLSSVLNDVTNMIVFKARQKDLTFNVNVDETLPDGLYGDEVRVRQVIVNILNNAVKYTHEGSVTMRVSGERDSLFLILTVEVRDTGIGIKKEDLPKLFSKFTRVDLAQNNTVEGTGLGLSITQNLLKLMNGTVEVASEYGKGSTFTLRIPQKIVSDEPIGDFQKKFEQYTRGLRAYHESFRAPEARILVVDDTEMNLTVVEGLLSKTEVQLDTASSGAEALRLTQDAPYDLILMDQRMPQMDGTEAMRHIRQQVKGLNRETPIICLTADAVTGARAKYLEEGFTDYLSKPIESAALEAALIKYLPPEKVAVQEVLDEKPEEEQQEAQPQSELAAFYAKTGLLNYANAVRCCSSEAILEKTLEQFYRSITPGADAIEGFFKEKDYKNYTIKVHALKSSARLIGADGLSADAKFLEECGNDLSEASLEQIEERTPKLLADYRGLLNTLASLYAAEEEARASAEEIAPEMLSEAYEAIKEFAENFDSDAIDGVLAELRQYRIPENEAARFEAIETAARNMDWNGLKAALN